MSHKDSSLAIEEIVETSFEPMQICVLQSQFDPTPLSNDLNELVVRVKGRITVSF